MTDCSDSYISPNWPAAKHIKAVITTRLGGVGNKPFDSFNLAKHVDDCESHVQDNRARLVHDHKLGSVCWLNQIHGITVVEAASPELNAVPTADASYTRSPGMACAVMVADCMPVLITDRSGSCVGAAHAGWRGLCSGVIPELISSMQIDPEQALVWLGPCIGPNAFEVGPEVLKSFNTSEFFSSVDICSAFKKAQGDRYMGNLQKLAKMQLSNMGITDVFHTQDCTYEKDERYFSYRRDVTHGLHRSTGRMAALIWIKD